MESAEFKANNAFLNYLMDCLCKPSAGETTENVTTIDGDCISESAMNKALKTGKGLIVGGFFVGGLGNDMNYSYPL